MNLDAIVLFTAAAVGLPAVSAPASDGFGMEVSDDGLESVVLKKTGALITAAVKTGAILGGAGNSELGAIVQYGRHIGLAFQIRDDILDAADEAEKGDLSRPNYVSLFGLETAKNRLKNYIDSARSALDEASLESEELHYLASLLLKLEHRTGK